MLKKIRYFIGFIFFIIGISSVESDNVFIPILLLVISMLLVKDIMGKNMDEDSTY